MFDEIKKVFGAKISIEDLEDLENAFLELNTTINSTIAEEDTRTVYEDIKEVLESVYGIKVLELNEDLPKEEPITASQVDHEMLGHIIEHHNKSVQITLDNLALRVQTSPEESFEKYLLEMEAVNIWYEASLEMLILAEELKELIK